MSRFTGVAVVTGAGSGVGREVSLALAGAGWAVVLAGRREGALRETADLAATAGQGVGQQAGRQAGRVTGDVSGAGAGPGATPEALAVVPADVTRPESVDALFATVRDRYGRLDLLFNNAGTNLPPVPFEDLPYEQWRTVVDVNLTGAFLCAQGAWRLMRDQDPQGGRIINNGSVSAYAPRPHSSAYTATKHAITGLTKSLSLDGRRHRIACGQIDIGNATTEMTARMSQGVPQADGRVASEPTMDAAHVASTVLHMAGLPLEANVQFVTVMATTMPLVGRG